jgi:hypothetical protein
MFYVFKLRALSGARRLEIQRELESIRSQFHAKVCVPRKRLRTTPQPGFAVFLT